MNEMDNDGTTAPPPSGSFQQITLVTPSQTASTSVSSESMRTVTTKSTQGEVTLRYTPREPRASQDTNS